MIERIVKIPGSFRLLGQVQGLKDTLSFASRVAILEHFLKKSSIDSSVCSDVLLEAARWWWNKLSIRGWLGIQHCIRQLVSL